MDEEEKKDETEVGTDEVSKDDPKSEEKEPEKTGGEEKSKGKEEDKSFSQEQVTRMMTKEKNQGRAAAFRELGIDPKDTKAVAMVKALINSQKDDDADEGEKAEADREAERRVMLAEAKVEAMTQGVKPKHVDDLVTLAMSRMSDENELKDLIGEFKNKYPDWFGSDDEDDKTKQGEKGTGSSVKSLDKGKAGSDGAKNLGARLAAQRKGSAKKSSYWGK